MLDRLKTVVVDTQLGVTQLLFIILHKMGSFWECDLLLWVAVGISCKLTQVDGNLTLRVGCKLQRHWRNQLWKFDFNARRNNSEYTLEYILIYFLIYVIIIIYQPNKYILPEVRKGGTSFTGIIFLYYNSWREDGRREESFLSCSHLALLEHPGKGITVNTNRNKRPLSAATYCLCTVNND